MTTPTTTTTLSTNNNFVTNLFENKFVVDERIPSTWLSFNTTTEYDDTISIGIVLPEIMLCAQMLFIMVVQRIIAAFCSVIIYKYIITPQKTSSSLSSNLKHTTALSPFLIGVGILIPMLLQTPFWFIRYLDAQSMVVRLLVCQLPLTTMFRVLEAIFGFTPPPASSSFKNYCIYQISMMEVEFDHKSQQPAQVTDEYITTLCKLAGRDSLVIFIVCSIFAPMSYMPFETHVLATSTNHEFLDLWNVGHLLNNFLAATLLSLSLSWGSNVQSLTMAAAVGIKIERMVDNPMFASTSPADFWGRRWNNMIHKALKRGVYKPVRKYCNKKSVAAAMTFLASGLLHEYCWAVLFFVHDSAKDENGYCSTCIYPHYGKNMVFFGWNGALIVMQYVMSQFDFFLQIRKKMPKVIVTMLVIVTALPIGHLFTGDWVAGGYYEHFQMSFPMLVVK